MDDNRKTERSLLDDVIYSLKSGGVALLPTDTVFGLAVSPSFSRSVDRLYRLKLRPRAKSLPIMVSNRAHLEELGVVANERLQALLESGLVPGALTMVASLDQRKCPDWLAGRAEIAFRFPNDRFLLDVLDETGPLLVTSANRSGQATPSEVSEVLAQLTGDPDIVVEGRANSDVPSTLVNCRQVPVRIERHGAILVCDIANFVDVEDA